MAVAVFRDKCFFRLPGLLTILRGILPNSIIKSSQVSIGNLISAWRWSLCNLSIWKDLTFKIFHHEEGSIILINNYPRLSEKSVIFLSKNSPRQVKTCCLSIGVGAMEISFKSEILTRLSHTKRYNYLRSAQFATHLTPSSSKFSSPVLFCFFFCQPHIENIFQVMNIIKNQIFIIFS